MGYRTKRNKYYSKYFTKRRKYSGGNGLTVKNIFELGRTIEKTYKKNNKEMDKTPYKNNRIEVRKAEARKAEARKAEARKAETQNPKARNGKLAKMVKGTHNVLNVPYSAYKYKVIGDTLFGSSTSSPGSGMLDFFSW